MTVRQFILRINTELLSLSPKEIETTLLPHLNGLIFFGLRYTNNRSRDDVGSKNYTLS